jgi:hypothetical protein
MGAAGAEIMRCSVHAYSNACSCCGTVIMTMTRGITGGVPEGSDEGCAPVHAARRHSRARSRGGSCVLVLQLRLTGAGTRPGRSSSGSGAEKGVIGCVRGSSDGSCTTPYAHAKFVI